MGGTFALLSPNISGELKCALLCSCLSILTGGSYLANKKIYCVGSGVEPWLHCLHPQQLVALRHPGLPFTNGGYGEAVGQAERGQRRHKPCLQAIVMGNARALSNKTVEPTALQREYRELGVVCITESWLHADILDSAVSLHGFTFLRADPRTAESCKRKGGGLVWVFGNNRRCNSGHVAVKEQLCGRDVELLAVSPTICPRN